MLSYTMGSSDTGSDSSNDTNANAQEQGVLAGVKNQIDGITRGSATDLKGNFVAVAGDTVNGVKETVLEGVPVAAEALQSAQDHIRSLAGGNGESTGQAPDVNTESHAKDAERIDQMDTEQICDFLRDEHRSTKPPPSTN